jgi:CRISPR type IV-associated protein Csf1
MKISPSEIVASGFGQAPLGTKAQQDYGACLACGHQINQGDYCLPYKKGGFKYATFTNLPSLANPHGTHICGHCAVVKTSSYLQLTSGAGRKFTVATRERIYSESSGEGIKAILQLICDGEIQPPFVATYSLCNKQHLAWMAPVSHSTEYWIVQWGAQQMTVSTQRVREACEDALRKKAADEKGYSRVRVVAEQGHLNEAEKFFVQQLLRDGR